MHFLGLSNRNFCSVSDRKLTCSHPREPNYTDYVRSNSDLESKLVKSISYLRDQLNSIKCKSSSMALKLLKLRCLRSTRNDTELEIIKNNSRWRIMFQNLDAESVGLRRKRTFSGDLTDCSVSLIRDHTPPIKDFASKNLPHLSKDFPPSTQDFLPSIKSKSKFNREGASHTFINDLLVKEYWQISHNSRCKYLLYPSRRNPSTFSENPLRLSLRISASSEQSRTFFPP